MYSSISRIAYDLSSGLLDPSDSFAHFHLRFLEIIYLPCDEIFRRGERLTNPDFKMRLAVLSNPCRTAGGDRTRVVLRKSI